MTLSRRKTISAAARVGAYSSHGMIRAGLVSEAMMMLCCVSILTSMW
jgi:hypothetical protein